MGQLCSAPERPLPSTVAWIQGRGSIRFLRSSPPPLEGTTEEHHLWLRAARRSSRPRARPQTEKREKKGASEGGKHSLHCYVCVLFFLNRSSGFGGGGPPAPCVDIPGGLLCLSSRSPAPTLLCWATADAQCARGLSMGVEAYD